MSLSLNLVDELRKARKALCGRNVGAPYKLEDGTREGEAVTRACVVMLSSSLQAFVGDVFLACSQKAFGQKNMSPEEKKAYAKTWNRWGNPSTENIINLFRRLGIMDVLEGLSWQKQSTDTLKKNLDKINQARNQITHNTDNNNSPNWSQINSWYKIAEQFGDRFEEHAKSKIR